MLLQTFAAFLHAAPQLGAPFVRRPPFVAVSARPFAFLALVAGCLAHAFAASCHAFVQSLPQHLQALASGVEPFAQFGAAIVGGGSFVAALLRRCDGENESQAQQQSSHARTSWMREGRGQRTEPSSTHSERRLGPRRRGRR